METCQLLRWAYSNFEKAEFHQIFFQSFNVLVTLFVTLFILLGLDTEGASKNVPEKGLWIFILSTNPHLKILFPVEKINSAYLFFVMTL